MSDAEREPDSNTELDKTFFVLFDSEEGELPMGGKFDGMYRGCRVEGRSDIVNGIVIYVPEWERYMFISPDEGLLLSSPDMETWRTVENLTLRYAEERIDGSDRLDMSAWEGI